MNPLQPAANFFPYHRREWFKHAGMLFAAAGLSTTTGCPPSNSVQLEPAAPRADVSLRVAWAGDPSDADVLRRVWGSVSDQPIDVKILASSRSTQASKQASLMEVASQCDVLVYPLLQMSELVSQKYWMPMPSIDSREDQDVAAALKVSVTLGDQIRGLPLGGELPAILVGENSASKTFDSWDEIDEAASSRPGLWDQPTAPMWAAWTYLSRAAAMIPSSWLFDRQTLQPTISDPDYVDVLARMKSWRKPGQASRSPSEIWEGIGSGALDGGLGFPPASGAIHGSELEVHTLPGRIKRTKLNGEGPDLQSTPRQIVDPYMLVASLSSACRQTESATRFILWLSGGEGTAQLYSSIPELLDRSRQLVQSSGSDGAYWNWWKKAVQNPNVVPALQLIDGPSYYQTLDEKVRECLNSDLSPQDACSEVAKVWGEIHQRVGLDNQKRTWQRALGLS